MANSDDPLEARLRRALPPLAPPAGFAERAAAQALRQSAGGVRPRGVARHLFLRRSHRNPSAQARWGPWKQRSLGGVLRLPATDTRSAQGISKLPRIAWTVAWPRRRRFAAAAAICLAGSLLLCSLIFLHLRRAREQRARAEAAARQLQFAVAFTQNRIDRITNLAISHATRSLSHD